MQPTLVFFVRHLSQAFHTLLCLSGTTGAVVCEVDLLETRYPFRTLVLFRVEELVLGDSGDMLGLLGVDMMKVFGMVQIWLEKKFQV
jgi:hypothetical protein